MVSFICFAKNIKLFQIIIDVNYSVAICMHLIVIMCQPILALENDSYLRDIIAVGS